MKRRIFCLLYSSFLIFTPQALADTDLYWIGISSADWNDPVNWYPYKDTDLPCNLLPNGTCDPDTSGYSNNSGLTRLPTTGDDLFLNNSNVGDYETPALFTNDVNYYGTSSGETFYAIHLNHGMRLDQYDGNLNSENIWLAEVGTAGWVQYAGVNHTNQNLTIGVDAGSSGTYLIDGIAGTLLDVDHDMVVGSSGNGFLILNSGRTEIGNYLYAGHWSSGYGEITLNDDTELAVNASAHVGDQGSGTIVQNHTSHVDVGSFLSIGLAGSGQYDLNDQATLDVEGTMLVGVYSGTGEVNQNSDETVVTVGENVVLGEYDGSEGRYELDEGRLDVGGNVTVGRFGIGVFEQDNAYSYADGHHVAFDLILGDADDITGDKGEGTYNLNGGYLTVGRDLIVGKGGDGYFTQSAETKLRVWGTLEIGSGKGTTAGFGKYEMVGGELASYDLVLGNLGGIGTITQQGSVNEVGNHLTLGKSSGSLGTYHLKAGTLYSSYDGWLTGDGDTIIGDAGEGMFIQDGGAFTVGGPSTDKFTLVLGKQSTGNGNFELNDGQVSASNAIIGDEGKGTLTQTSGEMDLTYNLEIGKRSGSDGAYILNGGKLTFDKGGYLGDFIVGDAGKGRFECNGGEFKHGTTTDLNIILGNKATGRGTFVLSALDFGYDLKNLIIGNEGAGEFINNGKVLDVHDDFIIGNETGSSGVYTLNDGYSYVGRLTPGTGEFIVGKRGAGTFNHASGENNVFFSMSLGQEEGSEGNYLLGSGELEVGAYSATPDEGSVIIGKNGQGTFTQTGGLFKGHALVASHYTPIILGDGQKGEGIFQLSGLGEVEALRMTVGNAGQGKVTQAGGTITLQQNLVLGQQKDSQGYFSLSDGELRTNQAGGYDTDIVGDAGAGTFELSGGYYSGHLGEGHNLVLGKSSTGSGSFSLTNDAGINFKTEIVGKEGKGYFTQMSGENQVRGSLALGEQANSEGNYILNDGYLATGYAALSPEEGTAFIGKSGKGVFNHFDGEYVVGNETSGVYFDLALGENPGSEGRYNLKKGNLTSEDLVVGRAGNGTFDQSGGVNTIKGGLKVGEAKSSSGKYTMSDGQILVDPASAHLSYIGHEGAGEFKQTGGSFLAQNQELILGGQKDSQGTYAMSGPSVLTVRSLSVGEAGKGVFAQIEGDNFVGEEFTMARFDGSQADYVLGDGQLKAGFQDTASTRDVVIGDSGEAYFSQSGGKFETGAEGTQNDLVLGQDASGYGQYLQTEGALENENSMIVGDAGTGKVVQYGSVVNGDALILGQEPGSQGTYQLNDGLFIANHKMGSEETVIGDQGEGKFYQNGGVAIFKNGLTIEAKSTPGNKGEYYLYGGELRQQLTLENNGLLRCEGDCFINGGEVVNNAKFEMDGLDRSAESRFNADIMNTDTGVVEMQNLTLDYDKQLTNFGQVEINNAEVTFQQKVVSSGPIEVNNSDVDFQQGLEAYGAYVSDPSTNKFSDLYVGSAGYLVGEAGDVFQITGTFENQSARADAWDTAGARLEFTGAGTHDYILNDTSDDFVWDTLFLDQDSGLNVIGDDDGRLVFHGLILGGGLDQLTKIHSGYTLYFDELRDANGDLITLAGGSYQLSGGGAIVVTPEPASMVLFGIGGAAMAFARRRRRV